MISLTLNSFKLIGILFFGLLLTSCSSNRLPQEVKVPVPVACPTPVIPPKPYLPIANLKPNSPPNTVIKAYAASIELLQGYSNQLIELLENYKH